MGWYPCSGCPGGSPCPQCQSGTTPSTVTVTLSGITDNNCDKCSNFNATFVLQQRGLPPYCEWFYELTILSQACYGFTLPNIWVLQANVEYSGGSYYWVFSIAKNGDLAGDVQYYSAAYASKPNCLDSPVTLAMTGTPIYGYCNWPGSVTLYPAA